MLVVLATGIILGAYLLPKEKQPVVYTEDSPRLIDSATMINIVLVDSVDGRPTYNVIFPDGKVIDSMYAEEIANGLITGVWDYNEDFKLTN